MTMLTSCHAVVAAGVDPGRIVVDPGLGFGKRPEHNWPLLAGLADIAVLAGIAFPVVVGASRKRFLGLLLAVTLILVGLIYFPIMALGPIVEHLVGHF